MTTGDGRNDLTEQQGVDAGEDVAANRSEPPPSEGASEDAPERQRAIEDRLGGQADGVGNGEESKDRDLQNEGPGQELSAGEG